MHVVTASAAAPPLAPVIDHSATKTDAGAMTRSAVRPHGRGASNATKPTAHAAQSNTPATRAGPVAHPSSASVSATPADTGYSAHVSRAHHTVTTVGSAS